uniref:M16 family metallopeptidase n=1 Tax=uncultured Acinetobacter sp. TaxID=165433 RepID=UPI00262E55A0|nr:pitrilysin family protein [uncultured Acinetobacter sp.]
MIKIKARYTALTDVIKLSLCVIATFSTSYVNAQQTEYATTSRNIQSDNETGEVIQSTENNLIVNIASLPYLQSLHDLQQHPYQAPQVQELFSKNGVRTLLVESKQLPIVDIQLTFNAGSARDESISKGLSGLANLTARLLHEGTSTQTANDIAQSFERLGAQYSAQAYRDMFVVRLRVLSDEKRLEPALNQLIFLLKDAQFPQGSIDRILNNAQVGQKQVKENPKRSMSVRFYREIYGDHPYAQPSTGTIQSLKRIKSEDIQAFKNQYLVANNLNIAITGNVNQQQAQQMIDLLTEQINTGESAPPLPDAQALEKAQIIHIPFNSSQAHVMIGQVGIRRDDPDRFALEVGNEIFGSGGFQSLLMQELREKRGLTYSASSNLSSMQSQGLFYIQYSTQREQQLESLNITYDTLLKFLHQPLATAQIEESKRGLIRAFPLLLRSNANINSQLGAIGFYGLPSNYLSQYQQYISAVSAEDIQRAWQKHIHPERFLTVLAGKDISTNEVTDLYEKLLAPYQLAPSQKTDDAEKNAIEVKKNSDKTPLATTP